MTHHTVTLDPSCDEDSTIDTSNSTPHEPTANAGSTDDGLLNGVAADYLSLPDGAASGGIPAGALLAPTSRSISVTSFEGDPPDVEEDRDFYETEDLGGEICLC